MPATYSVIEPHPQVSSSYIHAGRGGAGNFHHVQKKDSITYGADATGPASRTKLSHSTPSPYFMSGRGGAGNLHREKERAIFSFDEELEEQTRKMEQGAPVYHIGRGGAGNAINENVRKYSSGSTSSEDSVRSAARTARQSLADAGRRLSSPFTRRS